MPGTGTRASAKAWERNSWSTLEPRSTFWREIRNGIQIITRGFRRILTRRFPYNCFTGSRETGSLCFACCMPDATIRNCSRGSGRPTGPRLDARGLFLLGLCKGGFKFGREIEFVLPKGRRGNAEAGRARLWRDGATRLRFARSCSRHNSAPAAITFKTDRAAG